MENLKLPIALVAAMGAQLAGGVWYMSQQAATISSLDETVSQLGSRMAIEDNINLKRDVQSNTGEIENSNSILSTKSLLLKLRKGAMGS